jgi:hypothetical protein
MPALELRPGPTEYAEHYRTYVDQVPEGHIVATLELQVEDTLALLRSPAVAAKADYAYGPGKWTIKQVVGHVTDAERIFTIRALRFARADTTPLPAFDENAYVDQGGFEERPLAGLIDDFAAVRHASIRLFRSFSAEAWERWGVASGKDISVRALAWITAGHELHHRRILQERYLG